MCHRFGPSVSLAVPGSVIRRERTHNKLSIDGRTSCLVSDSPSFPLSFHVKTLQAPTLCLVKKVPSFPLPTFSAVCCSDSTLSTSH